MTRRANSIPGGGGGGGTWRDPTIYQRKREVEKRLGRQLTLEEFRQPELWVPPPADNFSTDGRAMRDAQDARRGRANAAPAGVSELQT
jgi:hypothetical protein